MNILYLCSEAECEKDVLCALETSEHVMEKWIVPAKTDDDSVYAEQLILKIQSLKSDAIFSLGFFPVVSLVCEVLKKKYAAWVVADYEPTLYSCTMLNECNHIFLSDYADFEEFEKNGFENIYYLPLAAQDFCVEAGKSRKGECEYQRDLVFLQRTVGEEAEHPMFAADSPLKDATRGYLDGAIACQYQITGLPSMAENLPGYVWEDLTTCFPACIDGNSVETVAQYYDYNVFNPLITYKDRLIRYVLLSRNEHFEVSEHRDVYTGAELVTLVQSSKVCLVVTHRSRKSGIAQLSWNIMAAGGFLLNNFQQDFLRIFQKETKPVLYLTEREMFSRGIYYKNHTEEREELVARLREEVCGKHTYRHRVKELLASLE